MTWTKVDPQYPPNINSTIRHGGRTAVFKSIRTIGGKPCCILSTDPDTKPYAVPVADCEWWAGAMACLHTAASWADFINGKYLSPDHPEWWDLEAELLKVNTPDTLANIKARWPEDIRASVRERWASDGRLRALVVRVGL